MNFTLAPDIARAVDARLASFDRDRFVARLWAREADLWSDDPAHHKVIANRLGWLDAPLAMRPEVARLQAFAADAAAEGFTRAVLLGMGGSSLAPEVLRMSLGVARGGMDLTVLDDTSPEAVRAVAAAHDPARTLFVVSSKSGTTVEVTSFEHWFFEWVRATRGEPTGRAFAYVTDPGSALEAHARERGARAVFAGIPDIGGRYSALSPFGLVPAALIGADLGAMLDAADAELAPIRAGAAAAEVAGVQLGAALGELARRGRDKLTLLLDPAIASFGGWVEQLVAESTGKSGKGIVPIVDEPLAAPSSYGADRVFVALGDVTRSGRARETLRALADAGHPVIAWSLAPASLGAEFVRWEVATATAAAILGIDPFDEPNVTEAKQATQAVLDRYVADRRFPDEAPVAEGGGLEVFAPPEITARFRPSEITPPDTAGWAAALASLARAGDYLAMLAYLHRTPARHDRLQRLRAALGGDGRTATTLGYGPRYLHSTGQLHKGGPDTGVFLVLTADEGEALPIPGSRFDFAALHRAQAAGDMATLAHRGRRVARIHLGADPEAGLDALIESVAASRPVE